MAALHANSSDARGLAGALKSLQQQPYGWALLGATALGLFAFRSVPVRHSRLPPHWRPQPC